jgi:hypothetical protein
MIHRSVLRCAVFGLRHWGIFGSSYRTKPRARPRSQRPLLEVHVEILRIGVGSVKYLRGASSHAHRGDAISIGLREEPFQRGSESRSLLTVEPE